MLSLTVARDADEAIRMANDSRYGLGASMYTNDLAMAMRAMQGIKAGTFWINDPLTDNDAAPFGGMRWSGIGRELGEEGLDAFREPKHVHLDYVMERKSVLVSVPRPADSGARGLGVILRALHPERSEGPTAPSGRRHAPGMVRGPSLRSG